MSDSLRPHELAHQAPPSTEFSRQEYWIGMSFPSPGALPDPGSNLSLLHCRQTLYHLSHQGSRGSPCVIHPYSSLPSPFIPLMIPTPGPSFPSDCTPHMILQDHDCLGHVYGIAPIAKPGSKQGLGNMCSTDNFFKANKKQKPKQNQN